MLFDAEKQAGSPPTRGHSSASAARIKELDDGEYVEVSVPMQDDFDLDLTAECDLAEDPGEDPAEPAGDCPGDFNGDGVIDGADMALLGDADPKLDLDGSAPSAATWACFSPLGPCRSSRTETATTAWALPEGGRFDVTPA